MLYRENGQFKTSYRADQQIFPILQDRVVMGLLLAFAVVALPLVADEYLLRAILIPVLILGGFTSVPGAIIGGLIIGAGEKLAEVFLGPSMGGGIEIWFAYVVALLFLLFRPQGLFGERIIERV